MHNLNQAREWAEDGKGLYSPGSRAKAAIDIILSLPDNWVDVEKVQEIIEKMETPKNKPIEIGYDLGVVVATEAWRIQLEALIAPKLPTLADMTEEERKACQWMQCSVIGLPGTHVLAEVKGAELAGVLSPGGSSALFRHRRVTPLPDLPKLEWPGGVVDCEIVDETPDDQQPNTSETPKSSIKPEDVPANEPWLIEVNGLKAIGARYAGDSAWPWSVATLD